MAVTCKEQPQQKAESHYLRPGGTRTYIIAGTRDKTTAALKLFQTAAATDTGVDIEGVEIPLILEAADIDELGGGNWRATVRYESSADVTDLQFTIGTVSTKIYQALSHTRTYDCINGGEVPAPGAALGAGIAAINARVPNHNGVIGVNGDQVEGVDVEVSNIEFSITKRRYRATLAQDYFQQLIDIMDLRTPVNDGTRVIKGGAEARPAEVNTPIQFLNPIQNSDNLAILGGQHPDDAEAAAVEQFAAENAAEGAPFVFIWKNLRLEFPEGSLRLRGIPIKWTSQNEVEITYLFHYSRPIIEKDQFFIGDAGPIIKEGHEYMWIAYRLDATQSQGTAGAIRKIPESVNIEQVYPKRNFNVLDL